jgi:hypothetical protein
MFTNTKITRHYETIAVEGYITQVETEDGRTYALFAQSTPELETLWYEVSYEKFDFNQVTRVFIIPYAEKTNSL